MDALRLVTLAAAFAVVSLVAPTASAAPRAFFVFGDSLVDNGNNNYLMTTARADAPPYGIDFPTHMPTGRFSNGLNIPDIISCVLHLFCSVRFVEHARADGRVFSRHRLFFCCMYLIECF
jgi:hypothetical protein